MKDLPYDESLQQSRDIPLGTRPVFGEELDDKEKQKEIEQGRRTSDGTPILRPPTSIVQREGMSLANQKTQKEIEQGRRNFDGTTFSSDLFDEDGNWLERDKWPQELSFSSVFKTDAEAQADALRLHAMRQHHGEETVPAWELGTAFGGAISLLSLQDAAKANEISIDRRAIMERPMNPQGQTMLSFLDGTPDEQRGAVAFYLASALDNTYRHSSNRFQEMKVLDYWDKYVNEEDNAKMGINPNIPTVDLWDLKREDREGRAFRVTDEVGGIEVPIDWDSFVTDKGGANLAATLRRNWLMENRRDPGLQSMLEWDMQGEYKPKTPLNENPLLSPWLPTAEDIVKYQVALAGEMGGPEDDPLDPRIAQYMGDLSNRINPVGNQVYAWGLFLAEEAGMPLNDTYETLDPLLDSVMEAYEVRRSRMKGSFAFDEPPHISLEYALLSMRKHKQLPEGLRLSTDNEGDPKMMMRALMNLGTGDTDLDDTALPTWLKPMLKEVEAGLNIAALNMKANQLEKEELRKKREAEKEYDEFFRTIVHRTETERTVERLMKKYNMERPFNAFQKRVEDRRWMGAESESIIDSFNKLITEGKGVAPFSGLAWDEMTNDEKKEEMRRHIKLLKPEGILPQVSTPEQRDYDEEEVAAYVADLYDRMGHYPSPADKDIDQRYMDEVVGDIFHGLTDRQIEESIGDYSQLFTAHNGMDMEVRRLGLLGKGDDPEHRAIRAVSLRNARVLRSVVNTAADKDENGKPIIDDAFIERIMIGLYGYGAALPRDSKGVITSFAGLENADGTPYNPNNPKYANGIRRAIDYAMNGALKMEQLLTKQDNPMAMWHDQIVQIFNEDYGEDLGLTTYDDVTKLVRGIALGTTDFGIRKNIDIMARFVSLHKLGEGLGGTSTAISKLVANIDRSKGGVRNPADQSPLVGISETNTALDGSQASIALQEANQVYFTEAWIKAAESAGLEGTMYTQGVPSHLLNPETSQINWTGAKNAQEIKLMTNTLVGIMHDTNMNPSGSDTINEMTSVIKSGLSYNKDDDLYLNTPEGFQKRALTRAAVNMVIELGVIADANPVHRELVAAIIGTENEDVNFGIMALAKWAGAVGFAGVSDADIDFNNDDTAAFTEWISRVQDGRATLFNYVIGALTGTTQNDMFLDHTFSTNARSWDTIELGWNVDDIGRIKDYVGTDEFKKLVRDLDAAGILMPMVDEGQYYSAYGKSGGELTDYSTDYNDGKALNELNPAGMGIITKEFQDELIAEGLGMYGVVLALRSVHIGNRGDARAILLSRKAQDQETKLTPSEFFNLIHTMDDYYTRKNTRKYTTRVDNAQGSGQYHRIQAGAEGLFESVKGNRNDLPEEEPLLTHMSKAYWSNQPYREGAIGDWINLGDNQDLKDEYEIYKKIVDTAVFRQDVIGGPYSEDELDAIRRLNALEDRMSRPNDFRTMMDDNFANERWETVWSSVGMESQEEWKTWVYKNAIEPFVEDVNDMAGWFVGVDALTVEDVHLNLIQRIQSAITTGFNKPDYNLFKLRGMLHGEEIGGDTDIFKYGENSTFIMDSVTDREARDGGKIHGEAMLRLLSVAIEGEGKNRDVTQIPDRIHLPFSMQDSHIQLDALPWAIEDSGSIFASSKKRVRDTYRKTPVGTEDEINWGGSTKPLQDTTEIGIF